MPPQSMPATTARMSYSNKPVHNITNGAYAQVYNRKIMAKLLNKRKDLDAGQADLLDCLSKSGKNRSPDRCENTVVYKLSQSTVGKLGYGRLYGNKGSLEQLEKEIRGSLCTDEYVDLDIVNCHPSIIPQMAKKWFNQEMPNLRKYASNRQDYFDLMEETMGFNDDATKSLVLRILYGGALGEKHTLPDDCEIEMPAEFIEMKHEMRAFTAALMNVPAHSELLDYLQRLRKPNVPGSFTAHIVQTEERKMLESMVYSLIEQNYKVDVLAYDGAQIRKGGNPITDQLIASLENTIAEETGYQIRLKIKPFETMVFEADSGGDEGETYEAMKARWEANYFYFRPSNTICELSTNGIQHFAIEHATEAFNGWKCLDAETGKNLVPFLKEWRNDATRRTITALVAKMPADCAPTELSLFRGWAFNDHTDAPHCQNAIDTFCDLVRGCAGDTDELYTYLLKCLARIVQQPLVKSNTCTILSSRLQGSGKDTLMLWFSKLLGNHVAHYSSEETFWSQYDTLKEGAIFLHLEEASPGENQRRSDALKARITEDTNNVNPKGIRAYTVPNMGNYFMTTNNSVPVKMEATDRRFLILSPSDRCFKKGPTYWNEIYQNFKTATWMHSVGKFLVGYDVSGFNPAEFPDTKMRAALLEVLEADCNNVRFMRQWVGTDCSGDELFESFKDWCRDNNETSYSKLTFCKMIASRCPELYQLNRTKTGMRYTSSPHVTAEV